MYNGSYTAGNKSSYGSYYNARVVNALTASETVSAKDYVLNICPSNWTLPTKTQFDAVLSDFIQEWNFVYAGYTYSKVDKAGSYGHWLSRTAASGTTFYLFFTTTTSSPAVSSSVIYNGRSARCLAK